MFPNYSYPVTSATPHQGPATPAGKAKPPPYQPPVASEAMIQALVPLLGRAKATKAVTALLRDHFILAKGEDPLVPLAYHSAITAVGSVCAHGLGQPPCPILTGCSEKVAYAYEPADPRDEPDPNKVTRPWPASATPSATPATWWDPTMPW